MPATSEIIALLDELETVNADALETQTLDFKEWSREGTNMAVSAIIEHCVCMANGGGGSLVIGVRDKPVGRSKAIVGVPPEARAPQLRKSVFDRTEPKIGLTVEEVAVPEGTGRLFVIQVPGDARPYTDVQGRAKIRVGTDCVPLTGSMRANMLAASGATDVTSETLPGNPGDWISPAAMERLVEIGRREGSPVVEKKNHLELLRSLSLISENGELKKAALLLAGRPEKIAEQFPGYRWSFAHMISSTLYDVHEGGSESIAVALSRIEELTAAYNSLTTVEQGLVHLEFKKYPTIALREALLNAFAHADYRANGVIQVRVYKDRWEIANPGGFIGGVSEANILRHAPVARNPTLVNAMIALRLVNRSNLGFPRMYDSMLREGKEPPTVRDEGNAVRLALLGSEFSAAFRKFVSDRSLGGDDFSLEHLLILNYLSRHGEMVVETAATICQQGIREARESVRELSAMGVIEPRKRGPVTYFVLSFATAAALRGSPPATMTKYNAARVEVLKWLAAAAKEGISSSDIQQRLGFSAEEAKYLLRKLKEDGVARTDGRSRSARWYIDAPQKLGGIAKGNPPKASPKVAKRAAKSVAQKPGKRG